MQLVRIIAVLVVLLSEISYFCYSGQSTIGNSSRTEEDHTLNLSTSLSSSNGPGIQYIIADKAGVLYEHSTGLADIKNRVPLSMNHAMAAFSMTKILTAVAVLQLVEQGKLDLDAPASLYVKHPYDQRITIRQLMNHTAGIPDPIPLKWVHPANDHQSFNEKAALAAVLRDHAELSSNPGRKYGYANIDYWLLGCVIETLSGESYCAYIRKNIFQRLRLPPREIDFTYSEAVPHAKGYLAKYSFLNFIKGPLTDSSVWGEYEGSWLHIKDVYVNGPSYGGAVGTARAFSVILRDLLSERSVLLGEDGRALLYERQRTKNGKEIDMTLGWHRGELNGRPYYFKEGGGAGFHSEMRVYPGQGLSSVIMTNQTSFNTGKTLNKLDIMFLGRH